MATSTAQFITKDPAKADGEESAYQYCGGDPVGKVDPSGEVSEVLLSVASVDAKSCCWSGAAKCIIKRVTGRAVSEVDLVKHAHGYYDPVWNKRGATTPTVQRVLSEYGVHSDMKSRALTFTEVKNQVNTGHAMYAGLSAGTHGHAVVVYGFRDEPVAAKDRVYFMDPAGGDYIWTNYYKFTNVYSKWRRDPSGRAWRWTDSLLATRKK